MTNHSVCDHFASEPLSSDSTIALSLYRIVLVVYACIYSTFGYAQISWLHNQLYVTVLHVFMISSIYRALKKL